MYNDMSHVLGLLAACFVGAGLLLAMLTYAESTLDRDDATFSAWVRRVWEGHTRRQLARVEVRENSQVH